MEYIVIRAEREHAKAKKFDAVTFGKNVIPLTDASAASCELFYGRHQGILLSTEIEVNNAVAFESQIKICFFVLKPL